MAVLLGAAMAGGPSPIASAHVTTVSTTPASGATVTTAPTEVKMVFSEAPTNPTLTVTGPDGATYSGATSEAKASVSTALKGGTPPTGIYTVNWKLTAPDGDAQNGSWTYFFQPPIQPKAGG